MFYDPTEDIKLRVVEFKVHAAEAMRDFDRFQKFARDLDLVIAWDEGDYISNNSTIYDIDQSTAYQASPSRVFSHVSKYIYDAREGKEVQVLLLEEVVAKLKEDEK